MTQDERHLNLLGIFHYIIGGITIFFSCIFLLYIGLGIAGLMGKLDGSSPSEDMVFGWIFTIVGSVALILGWTIGILTIVAGRKLQAHASRVFCLVIAALQCLNMPFGTILGVFTIIVLMKESVIALFERKAPVAEPPSTVA